MTSKRRASRLASKYAKNLNNDVQNGKRFKNGAQVSDTLQEWRPHTRHVRIMTSSRATHLKNNVHIRDKISWQHICFLMTIWIKVNEISFLLKMVTHTVYKLIMFNTTTAYSYLATALWTVKLLVAHQCVVRDSLKCAWVTKTHQTFNDTHILRHVLRLIVRSAVSFFMKQINSFLTQNWFHLENWSWSSQIPYFITHIEYF